MGKLPIWLDTLPAEHSQSGHDEPQPRAGLRGRLATGALLARVIAADGWSKDNVRSYLYENVTIPAREAEKYAWHSGPRRSASRRR